MSLRRIAYVSLSGGAGDQFEIGRGLRLAFMLEEVVSSFGGEPSTVSLYNLSQESIARIRRDMQCVLVGGYDDDHGIVDQGSVIRVRTSTQGTERITELQLVTREVVERAKFMQQYPAGAVRLRQVVQDCLDAMGAVAESLQGIPDETLQDWQPQTGVAKRELVKLLKPHRVGWSQRQGSVVFHPEGEPTPGAVLHQVNEREGMIGSPSHSEQGATVAVHFNRTIRCGDMVELESRDLTGGNFKVTKVRHEGDTFGTAAWSTKLELRDLAGE